MGQMAVLAPKAEFVSKLKPIVQNILVKQILMQDQDPVLQVRISFTQKLHKYLLAMKIRLYSLCALTIGSRIESLLSNNTSS